MVSRTGQLPRYPINDIIEPTSCTLQVPFDRAQRKKDMATRVALPPKSSAMYDGKPISSEYAWVDVTWTNKDYDEDEIDIPTEDWYRFIGATIGVRVLWNKNDIVLEMPTPAPQPSQPSTSPPDDPGDDDDDDSDDNDNNGGPGSSSRSSLPPGNSP